MREKRELDKGRASEKWTENSPWNLLATPCRQFLGRFEWSRSRQPAVEFDMQQSMTIIIIALITSQWLLNFRVTMNYRTYDVNVSSTHNSQILCDVRLSARWQWQNLFSKFTNTRKYVSECVKCIHLTVFHLIRHFTRDHFVIILFILTLKRIQWMNIALCSPFVQWTMQGVRRIP